MPKGSAVHAVNGRSQLLTEGSFVLIRPNDVHRYELFNSDAFEIIDIGIPETLFLKICDYLDVERSVFDAPALSPHCVLSGAVLSDVQRKLLHSGRVENPEDGYRFMRSVFPYLVGLFLTAPAPETAAARSGFPRCSRRWTSGRISSRACRGFWRSRICRRST